MDEFSGTNGFAAGVQIANTNGTLQLLNSIVAYGGTNGNAYGPITDLGFNISSDGSANFRSLSFNFTDPQLRSTWQITADQTYEHGLVVKQSGD